MLNYLFLKAQENRYQRSTALLLFLGANPNKARDQFGWAAIHRSAWNGDLKAVKDLIAKGADVNVLIDQRGKFNYFEGYTALALAASRGNIRMVRYLLEHGADPNLSGNADDYRKVFGNKHKDLKDFTPLCAALATSSPGHMACTDELLKIPNIDVKQKIFNHRRLNIDMVSTVADALDIAIFEKLVFRNRPNYLANTDVIKSIINKGGDVFSKFYAYENTKLEVILKFPHTMFHDNVLANAIVRPLEPFILFMHATSITQPPLPEEVASYIVSFILPLNPLVNLLAPYFSTTKPEPSDFYEYLQRHIASKTFTQIQKLFDQYTNADPNSQHHIRAQPRKL
jgi:hypothetical protein